MSYQPSFTEPTSKHFPTNSMITKPSTSPMTLNRSIISRNNVSMNLKPQNVPIQNPSTFRKLQLDIINSIENNQTSWYKTKTSKKSTLPIDDYKNEIDKSMENYTHLKAKSLEQLQFEETNKEYIEAHKNQQQQRENLITVDDQLLIKRIHDLNHSFVSRGYSGYGFNLNEESMLKVNVPKYEYKNPYQSIGVIKSNKLVHDEISKNFLERQYALYGNSIKEVEGYTMKYKVKMPKIKAVPLMPRITSDIPVIDCVDDKKKKDLPALPPIPQNGLKLFAYYRYPNKNFPEGREQFSLCLNGGEIYLVGGMSSVMRTMDVWSFNVENLEWHKINSENISNCRFGHSGVIYQNKIYIFGGRTKVAQSSVIANFDLFGIHERRWLNQTVPPKNQPMLRRNHIAQLIGGQMLIHGGLGENGEILGDCALLSFNPLKWNLCSVNPYLPHPCVYGHSSAVVVQADILTNHKFTIYKYPEFGVNKLYASRLKERGLYIFGGKTKEEGGLTNDLWILILGKKPLEWKKVDYHGTPPSPRYFHSMSYYEKGNYLIVHGGRNDLVSDSFALSDTYIFDLENFDWFKVELYSHVHDFKILSRCSHQSVVYSNKLLIFGGMNSNNYLGSSLLIVNLDFYYFPKLKSTEEIMIEKLQSTKDPSAKHKIEKLKHQIQKNQLGLVTQMSLPPIK